MSAKETQNETRHLHYGNIVNDVFDPCGLCGRNARDIGGNDDQAKYRSTVGNVRSGDGINAAGDRCHFTRTDCGNNTVPESNGNSRANKFSAADRNSGSNAGEYRVTDNSPDDITDDITDSITDNGPDFDTDQGKRCDQ